MKRITLKCLTMEAIKELPTCGNILNEYGLRICRIVGADSIDTVKNNEFRRFVDLDSSANTNQTVKGSAKQQTSSATSSSVTISESVTKAAYELSLVDNGVQKSITCPSTSVEDLKSTCEKLTTEKYFTKYSLYKITLDEVNKRIEQLDCGGIAVFARENFCGVVIVVRYGETASKVKVDNLLSCIEKTFSDCIFATTECELETAIINKLIQQKRRMAVAESFTGGRISARLTSVTGASLAFVEGIVSYADSSKTSRLFVDAKAIAFSSSVSFAAASSMASGLLKGSSVDLVAATTGYAGPTGDAGKCFIAVGDRNRINVFEHHFVGSREEITVKGEKAALEHLMDYLLERIAPPKA